MIVKIESIEEYPLKMVYIIADTGSFMKEYSKEIEDEVAIEDFKKELGL